MFARQLRCYRDNSNHASHLPPPILNSCLASSSTLLFSSAADQLFNSSTFSLGSSVTAMFTAISPCPVALLGISCSMYRVHFKASLHKARPRYERRRDCLSPQAHS